jgi:zinc transporter 9
MIVIIPEGVETVYKSSGGSHGHHKRDFFPVPSSEINFVKTSAQDGIVGTAIVSSAFDPVDPYADSVGNQIRSRSPAEKVEGTPEHSEHDEDDHHEPHAWVGLALISGFILMYLIDTLPRSTSASSQPQSFPVSLNQFSFNRTLNRGSEDPATPPAETAQPLPEAAHGARPSSTTIGLVIHAAADGIALGASSTNSSSNLSVIIFISLMIHKAPAAFGLTSVLLKQGLSVRMARIHLMIFSLAAPVGALLTWSAVHILGFTSNGESASSEFATGVLLLFSGGTFLYVAMHTMQTAAAGGHSHGSGHDLNDYAGVPMDDPYNARVPTAAQPQGQVLLDTMITVGGMLLPLLTQLGHHAH